MADAPVCPKFLAENPSTKRKSLTSPDGKPSKKLKTSDTPGEDSGNEKGEKKKKKKDALGSPLSPTIWGHMQVSCFVCVLWLCLNVFGFLDYHIEVKVYLIC